MSESLLPYYNRELRAIRRLAGEFADAYPKVAARLRVTPEAVDDPYVERLLEGVAFIAARVQQRLDDELPEFSETLLDMLAPQLLSPVPSMTTLRIAPPPESQGPVKVDRGLMVETEPVRGEPVRFTTCHDVTVWPLAVESFRLSGLPIAAPPNNRVQGAMAVLRITLRTTTPEVTFAKLGLDRLRLHLRGVGAQAALLHELLCTATLGIALADSPADPRPTLLGPECLQPAGFAPEEAALPWPNRTFAGYRLLTEWFAFPEKFLYLDFTGLEARTLLQDSDRLDVFVYLSRAMPELERMVGAENVALGCTPAINLFPQRCEPIALDGTQSEWMVVPDARRPGALEIYTVDGVRESRPDGRRRAVLPFYRLGRVDHDDANVAEVNYVTFRRGATPPVTGTQTWIELRDEEFDPAQPAEGVLTVEARCREIERHDRDVLARDILPDVEFGPIVDRKDADALSRTVAGVVEVPQLRPLALRVPAVVAVAEGEDALLRPALFLVAPRAAKGQVEAAGVQRLLQPFRFPEIGVERAMVERVDPARQRIGILVDDQLHPGRHRRPVAGLVHRPELPGRIDMEQGEGRRTRIERLARQVQQHRRILAGGIEHHRPPCARHGGAQDMDALRLQRLELSHGAGGHAARLSAGTGWAVTARAT